MPEATPGAGCVHHSLRHRKEIRRSQASGNGGRDGYSLTLTGPLVPTCSPRRPSRQADAEHLPPIEREPHHDKRSCPKRQVQDPDEGRDHD